MEAKIGSAAGVVWQYLHNQQGARTLTHVRQGTKLQDQLLCMAIGWLAREGKLNFRLEGRTLRLSLKDL
jgi:hypothetical protein